MTRFLLHPWMLAALAAVLIPVIIELLFRRRRRQVELPTIRYLLGSQAEKKVKRQDRLLLIVRCSVPLVLAAALARPMLAPGGTAVAGDRHVVLLIDDTISMGQQAGVSVAFALAKKAAARLVRVLPKGTKVSLITLGHRPEVRLEGTDDLYAVGEFIDAMQISHGAGSVAEALPLIRRCMGTHPRGRDEKTELYVFSDFQKTTWLRRGADAGDPVRGFREVASLGEVYLVDVGGSRPFNYFLTDLRPEEPLLVTNRAVRFRATVEAKGSPATDEPRARVTFLVDGDKQGMQEVPLKAGRASATFEYRFTRPGECLVEAGVEGDDHRLDNRRFYLASVSPGLGVLILDEASTSTRMSAEARFLAAAVSPTERPGLDRTSIFDAKVLHPAEVVREDLGPCVAVVLLGMERVPPELVSKVEPYVREGGCAVFFLSGRTNPWEYNEKLFRGGGGILPVPLDRSVASEKGETLGLKVGPDAHPAFASFTDEDVLEGAEFTRWMSLADAGVPKAEVIASFTNGRPAVVEKKIARGRAVAFCMAAGPPESLMPASVSYPVLVQELLRYLAGDPDAAVNLEDGATFIQDVMISSQHLVLRKPDGTKVRLTPVKTGDAESLTVSFDGTDRMGRYEIDAQPGVLRRTRFVVNLKAVEGDLDRLTADDARSMFGSPVVWVGPGTPVEEVVKGKYSVLELAGTLLWVLAGLLAFETLLAMRFGLRRR